MTIAFARFYRLVARGEPGLACDEGGVALGPLSLVESISEVSGRRAYRMRPVAEVAQALGLAYGAGPDDIERCQRGLAKVAELLTAGELAQAGIRAVLLALPEIGASGMAKLTQAADLQKYNPNWDQEARNPAAAPGAGEWTGNGEESRQTDIAYFQPAAAQISDVQAKKERFVEAHLDDTQKAADELGIPVENILALAALESRWGNSRFAVQGHNYFGIHWPAPYATGYLEAKNSRNRVAIFASYADSVKSFIAISGSLVRGKSDPVAFAAALQNSGKFGIDPDTGAKVPGYVAGVAGTISGLRTIVARRKI
ncbi:MAG: glucosaminidase domain-containing protein [Stellaceae bacterium]